MKPYADHFSRLATSYASCRPHYPEELFSYLSEISADHELAWDCAAGSGQATLPLVRYFRRILATDASQAMLERAPRHPQIEYRAAPAEASGLASATADLVTVAQALHWLELDTFYPEVERVLKPEGILAVWTYRAQPVEDGRLDRILDRFYTDVVGPYWPIERRHVELSYRSLPFPFAELETPAFVMEEHWTLPQLLGYIRTWSAAQRYREDVGRDPVDELGSELAPLWGDPASACRIRWQVSLRVGRRRRSSPKQSRAG